MAGLLDGDLKAVFGSVFGSLLLDATLHTVTLTPDGAGGFTQTTADVPVKAMEKKRSAVYRAQAGIPATDINVLVLQEGVNAEIGADDEITLRGVRYKIKAPVSVDAAEASWDFWATPAS